MNIKKTNMFTLIFILILSYLFISTVQADFIDTEFKDIIHEAIQKREETVILEYNISIEDVDLENIQNLIDKTMQETDDYTASAVNSWELNIKGTTEKIELNINFDYHRTPEMEEYVFSQVQNIYAKIITEDMVIDEKIKAISDYIAKNVLYDETVNKNSAYEALKYGMSACEGYAQLTYLLLKEAGIKNIIISGWLNEPHAWNMVKIEEEWYHLDTTQIAGHLDKHGEAAYNEYLITDKAISFTHDWEDNKYPQAITLYKERLQKLKKENELYEKLWEDLNINYLQEAKTVSSHEELEQRIKKAFLKQEKQISFRSFENIFSVSLLKDIISNVVQKQSQYKGIKIKVFPLYLRDEKENSIIVELRLLWDNTQ